MDKIIEGTEREYNLTCKIQISKHGYIDEQSDGRKINRESFFVFFIPIHNSEAYAFMDAWLPLTNDEQVEVAMSLKHPFNTNARGVVRRSDHRCSHPHIMLMSFGLAQVIIDHKEQFNAREIQVRVLSEHDDAKADLTFRGDLPFDKKRYGSDPSIDESNPSASKILGHLDNKPVYEDDAKEVYKVSEASNQASDIW